MGIDISQKMYLKLELDGTAGVKIIGPADFRSLIQQAIVYLMSPQARFEKRNGAPEIVWTFSKQPPATMIKSADSQISKRNEIAAGLDLEGVEILDDSLIESMRDLAISDPLIQRLIQVNTIQAEFDKCLPSERAELLAYAKSVWPEFMIGFERKHLAGI